MTRELVCRVKPYIQPFERVLAVEELRAIAGCDPHPLPNGGEEPLEFAVASRASARAMASQLAYWESVRAGSSHWTVQVLREATVNVVRNGIAPRDIARLVPFRDDVPVPNRRCLRYGPHGLHEYRGRFFPQLVRALINIAGIPANGLVADPMCGSGTALVEATLTGRRALGMDLNPLSVLMARTKCDILSVEPEDLVSAYERVREALLHSRPSSPSSALPYLGSLPGADQDYLARWFSGSVLADLDQISVAVNGIQTDVVRRFVWLALSNILRRVSWQRDGDLRIRREVRPDADIDPVREFLDELGRSVRQTVAFLYQLSGEKVGQSKVTEGDARLLADVWGEWIGKVDLVVTSPPYATALPYLDTDRLSLCYLGLSSRPAHRTRERQMIGNREVTETVRQSYWLAFRDQHDMLPARAVSLIQEISDRNDGSDAGFRRRNLPALLAKYFLDMREVLTGTARLLRPNAPAVVVVGDNHTIAGGTRVEIETASLLAEIASSVGLVVESCTPMEMLASRDIFRRNAVGSEYILTLRRARQ